MRYCFQTPTWSKINFRSVLLTKVYRQTDKDWVDKLNKIKMGEATREILDYLHLLKRPLGPTKSGITPTRLYTHRQTVDNENDEEFKKLKCDMYEFDAIDYGQITKENKFDVRDLTEAELEEHRKAPYPLRIP